MSEKEVHKNYQFVETVSANRINWGAILGGTVIGLFSLFLLTLLGVALGQGAISALYLAIATIFSVFIGAWATGRFSGLVLKNDGMLHGIATLALITLISLVMMSMGFGHAMQPGATTGAAMPIYTKEFGVAAAWTGFITGLLSLIAASYGGLIGMKSRPIKDEHRPLSA